MVNVAVVALGATVTLAGTVAADVALLVRVTTAPPAGAGLVRVRVPVDEFPPRTLVGFKVRDATAGAFRVKPVACTEPLKLAVIVGEVVEPTAFVVTAKVAVVAFAATVTEEGTCAAALLLESATANPPTGAGPFRVTVPVEENPPTPLFGFKTSEVRTAGFTVSPAVCAAPL
jgi:hypothetical protein